MLRDRLAFALLGTPLAPLARAFRWGVETPQRWRHPELREIYREGSYIRRLMPQLIHPSDNCVDVGCHLGSFLSDILKLAPRGRHLAIEPIPYKADLLRKRYPGVQIHQVALADRESLAHFDIDPRRSGFSHLSAAEHRADLVRIDVRVCRLDDLVPRDRPIHFMKIDVEGAECALFEGARRILTTYRPTLLFECTLSGLRAFGRQPAEAYAILTESLGYDLLLPKSGLDPSAALSREGFIRAMQYPFQAFNFLALPRRN